MNKRFNKGIVMLLVAAMCMTQNIGVFADEISANEAEGENEIISEVINEGSDDGSNKASNEAEVISADAGAENAEASAEEAAGERDETSGESTEVSDDEAAADNAEGSVEVTLNASDDNSGECSINSDETTVSSTDTVWGTSGTTYVVESNITNNNRIVVSGNVTLILSEGTTLTATKGITVLEGNSLTIKGSGTLLVTGPDDRNAGIGGTDGNSSGEIVIEGGTVSANGGKYGAGIGGGLHGAGTVTITGGTVSANGGDQSAGIGGGGNGGGAGIVSINGGTITATGGEKGAGIGGGYNGDGTVSINGGTVTAAGDSSGAGIGGGSGGTGNVTIGGQAGNVTATGGQFGAGIGGGGGGAGTVSINGGTITATGGSAGAGIGGGGDGAGTVSINGGEVTATGGNYAAGIGGGYGGAGTVSINGGKVTATGASKSAGIGGGYSGSGHLDVAGGTVEACGSGSSGALSVNSGSKGDNIAVLSKNSAEEAYSSYTWSSWSDITSAKIKYIKLGTKCKVTFNANGGSGTMTNQDFVSAQSQAIKSNAFTRGHYSFISWNTASDGKGTGYADGETATFDKNTTLYAQWKADEYTVSFNANGGSGSMLDQTFTYGLSQEITANTFTREGYVFTGWNTVSSGSGTSYSDQQNVSITGNITFYAQWARCYTLSFDNNGGSGSMPNQTFIEGISQKISANTFTHTSLIFTGWNTVSDGSGKGYADQAEITISENTTLYARWKDYYSVTFEANGHGSAPETQYIIPGGKAEEPQKISATGYTFGGWYREDDCTTAYNFNETVSENITLYAKWTPSYSFILDTTSLGLYKDASRTITASITPAGTEDPGKVWSSSDTSIATVNNGTVTAVSVGSAIITVSSESAPNIKAVCEVTVYKNIEVIPDLHTVTFKNDSSTLATRYVEDGNTVTAPESPSKDGYTFVGWEYNGSVWNLNTPVHSNLTLTAKFISNTVTASENTGSGKDTTPPVTAISQVAGKTAYNIYLVKGQTYSAGGKGWETADKTIATVGKNNGKITGKNTGTVTVQNDSTLYNVYVANPEIAKDSKKLSLTVGQSDTVTLNLNAPSTSVEDNYTITWASSNPRVASVAGGLVSATAKGSAKITAYVGGKSYQTKVTVTDTIKAPGKITSSSAEFSMTPLQSFSLKFDKDVFTAKNAV